MIVKSVATIKCIRWPHVWAYFGSKLCPLNWLSSMTVTGFNFVGVTIGEESIALLYILKM